MLDKTSEMLQSRAFAPVIVTDDTPQVSQELDLQDAQGATLLMQYGTLSDANATTALVLQESDTSGSGFTDVADKDLIGTEAAAAPIFSDDNKSAKLGYKGTKRYLKATLTPSGNTGNIPLSGIWIKHNNRALVQTSQLV